MGLVGVHLCDVQHAVLGEQLLPPPSLVLRCPSQQDGSSGRRRGAQGMVQGTLPALMVPSVEPDLGFRTSAAPVWHLLKSHKY